jgi:curved DNA-binding protein CbpA
MRGEQGQVKDYSLLGLPYSIFTTIMDDYYNTLELERGATADEIKANYRRLAMKWHPDRNAGSAAAEERFKRISEAYAVLSDEAKRRDYDLYRDSPREEASFGRQRGRGFAASAFSAEEAAFMFMNEMYNLAMELTMQNIGWQDIAQELERRGCPAEVARDIARQIEGRRKALIRGRAKPYFVRSAVSGIFGLGLFAAFGGVGLGIIGFLGLIMTLSGAYNLTRALYFIATGRAPKVAVF